MGKKLRYTGELPPARVLTKHPNWVQALDEEGEDGQDETTLRPDNISDHVGPQTQCTAADITFASGKKLPALLFGTNDLWNGNAESIAVYEGKEIWHVEFSDRAWWPDPEATSFVSSSLFPATIVSRLPGVPGGQPLKFELLAKGKLRREAPSSQIDPASPDQLPFRPKDISADHAPETGVPNHETSGGKPSAEWIAQMKKEVRMRGYFGVTLRSDYNWKKKQYDAEYAAALQGKPCAGVDAVLDQALLPVFARAQFCRVFGLQMDTPKAFEQVPMAERNRWISEFTQTMAKGTFVDLRAAPPLREHRFWWWLMRRSHGLVVGVPASELRGDELFRHADYPTILTNLGAVIDKTAISFAKRRASGGQLICLCPDRHSGLEIHLFAETDIALELFDRAVNAPKPAWIFPNRYSRYWVRTFEQEAGLNFLFEAEEKRSLEFLSLAIKSAISNLNHPATVLRALAAAEIIAAAHGKPAARYNGHPDRSIDRSVLHLAKKLTAPSREVVKSARELVAIISEHSSAPQEIWLSEEARHLWQQRQIDLHFRLKQKP